MEGERQREGQKSRESDCMRELKKMIGVWEKGEIKMGRNRPKNEVTQEVGVENYYLTQTDRWKIKGMMEGNPGQQQNTSI